MCSVDYTKEARQKLGTAFIRVGKLITRLFSLRLDAPISEWAYNWDFSGIKGESLACPKRSDSVETCELGKASEKTREVFTASFFLAFFPRRCPILRVFPYTLNARNRLVKVSLMGNTYLC